MSIGSKLAALDVDDVYQTLMQRLETETNAILGGAGDDVNWLSLYEQVLAREKAVLYG